MGVFFFISSYLLGMKNIDVHNIITFIKRRILTILVPFLSWTFIVRPLFFVQKIDYYSLNEILSEFTRPWLWFLLTLFIYDIIYAIYSLVNSYIPSQLKLKYDLFVVILMILSFNLIYKFTRYFKMEAIYIYYFILGIVFNKYKDVLTRIINNNMSFPK